MDKTTLTRKHAPVSGGIVLLATVLAALLLAFIVARPSEAADPVLTVDPTTVGFGAVQVGTSGERTVTITNTSGTAVTIGAIKFVDPVTGAELVGGPFSLADPLPVGGLTVQPGQSTPLLLDVDFSPTADTGNASNAVLTFTEGLVSGALGNTIGLVDAAGNTAQGIDLTGIGTQLDPFIQPGAQGCTIVGTNNGETLTGTSGHDVICGLGGNDKINGLGANDVLKGGRGNDRITDHKGKDKLLGQGGRDRLNSRDHARGDVLKGGARKDRAIKDKKDRARGI
jgi:Ca2+-binding RTX toxin-like protein